MTVGTTLNHYRLVRLLGKGGMGEVYAALSQLTKQPGLHEPVWAPDGSKMVASEFVNVNRGTIFDPRTAWKRQTPQMLPAPEGNPAWQVNSWSPDGQYLAGTTLGGDLLMYSLAARTYTKLADRGLFGDPRSAATSGWRR